jgi:hypothetical protein
MCEPPQLEVFVDYFISKKITTGEPRNLEPEADSPELHEKLVIPAITALQGRDHKYVSILTSALKRNWTQTDSKLRFIVQFVLACRRPWDQNLKCGIWFDDREEDFSQVPLTIEILKILESEFSEPQIKKSELAQRMDGLPGLSCWALISASVGRMKTETLTLPMRRMKLRLRLRVKLYANSATRPELSRRLDGSQEYGIRFYY